MPTTILVVDNDKRLLSVVASTLRLEGYRVMAASDDREALHRLRQDAPDLMVVDPLALTGMDGRVFVSTCRREHPHALFLWTIRFESPSCIAALGLKSEDCIAKPFRPRDLLSRISLAFHRAGQPGLAPRVLEAGGIVLDKGNRFVRVGPRYVDLTPSEFDLLAVLMSAPGRVISRPELLEILQGVHCDGNKRLIDIHIKNLRAKIEPQPHSPRYIETVYGFGYRFCRPPANGISPNP